MTDWFARLARHLRALFLASEEEREPVPPSEVPPPATTVFTYPAAEGSGILRARARVVTAASPAREEGGGAGSRRPRFLLSVDGAGQALAATGDRLTIGHLRAGIADLPFLADVGPLHAELARVETLREGPVWTIRPLRGESVRVDGEEVAEGGRLLAAGATVRLGENLAFRFAVPDDASSTVLLEILTAAECAGARTVALCGEGEGGRLRVGAAEQRHLRVPGLEHEISIVVGGTTLLVRCEAGVRRPEESTTDVFSLPLPLRRRVDLQVGTSRGGRPPFSLTLSPADLPEPGPRGGER